MDLTLANHVVFDEDYRNHMPFSSMNIDPRRQEDINRMFSKPQTLPQFIPPHTRALLHTTEIDMIPEGHIGIIGLRSTWARLGFISPMTIADPGFYGSLTMELWNSSPQRILVCPGDQVWSMHLVPVVGEEPYTGRYQGQRGLQLPKALPGEPYEAPTTRVREVDRGH